MPAFRIYYIPACLTLTLFCAFFVLSDVRPGLERRPRERQLETAEIAEFPRGRVLYVVIDEKAIFVGEEPIPFDTFDSFLREDGLKLRPDYAVVLGTDLAPFGKVVSAYASIRHILAVPETIVTRPVAIGTRHRAIEEHTHYWEYDREEEEEPNQP